MKEAFEKIKQRLEEESKFAVSLLNGKTDRYVAGVCDTNKKAIQIVSEVEAEYGNRWIDVKDRLPEKDGYYLTCDHKGNIHVFYHHPIYVKENMAFGICKNHPQFYQPIAWMELPKPYNRLERK